MARVSYGDDVKARVRQLLERLLAYANDEIENGERFKIDFNWQTPKQLVVRTQLRVLMELAGLEKEQVRDALKALAEFLGVLEDLREHKRGSENWHFKLTLWCDKGDKDGNLKQLDAEWQRLREELPGVQRVEARKAKPKPTFYENIPLSGVLEFVGRETDLQNLHQLLQENEQVVIAAVAGMGGVGKTELALQYARNHRETYKGGICWLLTKSGDVGIQVVQFARTVLDLNLPEGLDVFAQVQYCWRHWREGDVLLVLDDVGEYELVKPYLPSSSSRFKVLITTRQHLGASIKELSLDVLQPEAALELLKSFLKETPQRIEQELAVANQLCEWLGYLPLGLELVGRYLKRKVDVSLTEMLQRLEKKRLEQPALIKPEGDMTAQRGVLAAFELSWQELNDDDKQLGCLLSLFAPAPIAWDLVKQCLAEEDEEELEKIQDDKLLNLHLLQRKDKGVYQLHPLLREFFQYKLTGLEQAEELKRSLCRVMVAVAEGIPEDPTLKQITDVSPAIPHLAEVANNLIQYVNDEDLIWPFLGSSQFYEGQGLYNEALPWCKQCLEVNKKRLGKEHPNFATSLKNLAYIYKSQGRYTKAEPLYLQALELRQHLLGQKHSDVADILNELAELYREQGRYTEAEPLYLQALELRQSFLQQENSDVADLLNNLALLYYFQGRYSEAEPLYVQVLELDQRFLGKEHPDVATSFNNLGMLYASQGKYSEAEVLFLQALELKQYLLGAEHPLVADTLYNLATLYTYQGKYGEAELLLLQVLELDQRLLAEEHPNFGKSLSQLGHLYTCQGRYGEAEPLYVQVLELRRCLLGEEHPDFAISLNNLAYLYKSQGRYSEAEPLYLQSLALKHKLLGEEHPSIATSLKNLAVLYESQGRYNEAKALYLQALNIFERRLGVDHPNTVTVRENLTDLRDRLTSQ
jgi:tetratricopeptide (TPR) repeat protein